MKGMGIAWVVATAGLILVGTSSMVLADKRADVAAQQQILAGIQGTPDLEDDYITVTVDDVIATLEGTVDSAQEKKEAQQLAHVDGILGVNNRLQVRAGRK
jgi:osmotically-inducible protein OsmY